ncbi:MAG: glycosyltransferase family protein [Spirochaetales bacterium]|nr:glycosyltransferase family protein [Spirochaetales bacterium]
MIAAIIQARMGSTRLPGKVLKEVNGKPLLMYQVERVRESKLLDKVIVATSALPKDDVITDFCERNNIDCFRGSENDVLSRYYECAKKYKADIIVRLTADCPLLDPMVIDRVISMFQKEKADYAANTAPPKTTRFPNGSDVEVFSIHALERAFIECKDLHDREHVTFYFWRYDNNFKTIQMSQGVDWSKYRFTVDYPEDLEVVEYIFQELGKKGSFGHLPEIVDIIDAAPEIKAKNAMHHFGEGWKK